MSGRTRNHKGELVAASERRQEWRPLPAERYELFPRVDLEEDYIERLAFSATKHRLVFGLGGIPTEIVTDSDGVYEYLLETLGAFAETTAPVFRLEIGRIDDPLPVRKQLGAISLYVRGDHVVGKFREMVGYIDVEQRIARGLISGRHYRQDLFNFFRLAIDAITPTVDAVLFHTAGIARNGKAYIFHGPSTAGKSTLSALAATRHQIMTDDMLILRIAGGELRAATCGFWGGETNCYESKPIDLPVAGLFRLRKGRENSLTAIPTALAALDIVCGVPSMARPPSHHQFLLDFATRVAKMAPCHELKFHKRDDSFWSVIDAIG